MSLSMCLFFISTLALSELVDPLWALLDERGRSCLNWKHLWLMIAGLDFESIKQADSRFFPHLCCLPSCLFLENTNWRLRRTLSLSWRPLVRFFVFGSTFDDTLCSCYGCFGHDVHAKQGNLKQPKIFESFFFLLRKLLCCIFFFFYICKTFYSSCFLS